MFGIPESVMSALGAIQFSSRPMFVQFRPAGYRVRGAECRDLMQVVRPGDLLLRFYDHYLDNMLIPGHYTHIGVYVGAISPEDQSRAGRRIGNGKQRQRRLSKRFKTGPQMVVHSMSQGVFAEDLLDFARCDELVVLRLPEHLRLHSDTGNPFARRFFDSTELELQSRLLEGEVLQRSEVIPSVIEEALANLGRPYDFDYDFGNFARLSCTELVYFCLKSVANVLDLQPRILKMGPLSSSAIVPDDFLKLGLDCVWHSREAQGFTL